MDTRLVVILSLVASAIAGPITIQESDKCSIKCIDSTKFKYNPGTTYVYDYRVDTDSSLAGASEDSAKSTIQTTVNIEVLSQCEFALQLRNTKLIHTDGNGAMKTCDKETEFRSLVEGSPLRFSFQDGIVDQVCGEKEDAVESMNLKKGILSAFQNSMDSLTEKYNVTETDVAGTCKTEYTVVSNGYYTTEVKKVKDILSCSDRMDYMTMLQLTPYKLPSDLQNFPIMKTTHECQQSAEVGGVLKSSVCKESHVYRPFSNKESGGRVTVTQTLTYKTYSNGISIRAGSVKARSSLLFDHSADHPSKQQARSMVEAKLNEICDTTRLDARPETPRLFTDLVAAMKGLDKQDLTDLHRLLKTKTMCPTNGRTYKHFHDAMPMIGSSASIGLMTELIKTKDVTGLEAKAWLTSLAFVQKPTSEMLLDVKALIDDKEIRDEAMLPVSSMINNFCKTMGTCNQDYAVLSLMSSLERNIGYSCDASGTKFGLTLMTLKAIGNAGHAIRAIPVLNKCLTSTSNPLEIRVAAADAFRRMPCAADNKNLWETFTDKDLDSELRISAYLALMRCPEDSMLGKIAAVLNAEEDEQVGAFVYSHLTNLRETSDPHKQGVAEAINNLALDKEFDLSPMKYSRNFEVSALINKLNTGVVAESNLIWSNKVQLPRAVSGNLTVQLFGQSVNLFDFGGRLEGLEYLIKNLFGPYMDNEKESWAKIDADNVKGSAYGRIFGNEMLFMHSQTTQGLFGKKAPSWLDMVIKMANKQHIALTQSVQFMDLCMVVPSIAGLPIHLRINGTATVDLNMSGKMDMRKVGASPRSMDVDGEIRPSAALEVTGTMYVDSFVSKTGMRMRNTMHTSTALKGRIQLNRGQQLNVELDTPEDKMEIFDAKSQFFVIHDTVEKEQEMIKENRKDFKYCSSNQVTKMTGMEICGELSFPNASMKADSPYFPLTGPVSASVILFKRDSHTGYKLFAKRVENKKASTAQISINTPGSQVNRAISMDMSLNYKKQNAEINMATPWKKVAVSGNLINLKDLKSLSGNLVIDDKDTYAMTGEVKVTQSKNKVQVNPMFELRRPGADNVQVTGFMSMEKPLKELNMEMSLSGINKLPYTMKSGLTNNKKEKSISASISLDGKKEYSFQVSNVMNVMGKKSIIAVVKNLLEVRSPERKLVALSNNVDYRADKSLKLDTSAYIYRVLKKPATLKVNLQKTARKKATNYKAVLNLKSSAVSGTVVTTIGRKPNGFTSINSKVDYTIPKVSKNGLRFTGKFNDKSTKAYKSYIVTSNIAVTKNPEFNSNTKVEIGHKKKLSYVTVDTKYGANYKDKTKRLYLLTSLNRKIATLKQAVVNYKVKAQAPSHEIDILVQGKHQHNNKLVDSSVKLTYAPKKVVETGIVLRDRSTKLTKMNGKVSLSFPGKNYVINTDLTQKNAKQYAHSLNFKSNAGTKHTISTIYKMPKSDSHDAVVNFRLHKMKPVTISGSTNLNPRNFAAAAEFKRGKEIYGINTQTKISKAPNAKVTVEMVCPSRRVTFDVSGGKVRGKYEGSIETAWDADNDKDSRMSLDGGYFRKSAKGSVSMGGNVNFRSPFKSFENLVGSMKYGSDPTQNGVVGKFMWGGKADQIITTMTLKKPFNLKNLQFNGDIKTPFKGIRNAEIDIAHKFDNSLSTTMKGNLEKENAKLSVQFKQSDNGIKGNMNLKSTIKNAEAVSVSFVDSSKDGAWDNNAEVNHNGNKYAYDLKMTHSGNGWQRMASGDLVLTMNKQKVSTQWNHKNTDGSVKSSLSSKWGNKRLEFDLDGSHELSELRNINGVLKIKSPWKPVRDIELNIDHKHGVGMIKHIAFFRQGKHKDATSKVNYKRGDNTADFDFVIATPFSEDLSGKLNTNYDTYPMTTSASLQWAPKMKGTVEGSLNLASWNDADLNLKMTTPCKTLRNVVLRASNKKQGGEHVSNLNLDYGMRQNIDLESRIANEDNKKAFRLKLKSPFECVKSLDTGLNFNGNTYNFDSNVDFELLPNIGKFDGAVNWQYDNELSGKIRLDTPFPEYPYFEISTSSKNNGANRVSHIQAEYYPRQVYSFDATYNFDLPLSVDATIRSPFPKYNDIGMIIQHNMDDTSIKCHGEVKYQSDKTIEADIDADWKSNIEGNLVVKTPFRGYETNKISMRHRGELKDFDTHGEINVAEQNLVADASFKNGYTTTGTFTFTSPIPGLELIDASLKKRGNLKNIKGSATINVNGEKIQTTFTNKLMKEGLKTNLNIMTPFTETFKLGLDHSGLPESFTNKININYGRKVDIDTIASFDLRENDVNGNGILKYKLDKSRKNTARVSFSKSGTIDDLSFTTTAALNRDDISVSGSMRTKSGIEGSVQIKTPFDDFKNTGMTLSHSGDLSDFTSSANVNYMDGKHINGKVEFSSAAGNGIKLTTELTTPFKTFESTTLKFNHDISAYSSDISGNAELTSTIGGFGSGDITYSKNGDLKDLVMKGTVSSNGKDLAVMKATNKMEATEMHSMYSLKTAATPDLYLSIDHSGDRFSFNTKTLGKIGKNMVSTDANMKQTFDSITADSSLTYKLKGERKNTASLSLQKDGSIENCNMELTGKFNDDEAKLTASKSGPLNDMHFSGSAAYNRDSIDINGEWMNTESIKGTLKVATPFDDFKNTGIVVSHTGDLSDFSTGFTFNFLDDKEIKGKVELTAYTMENIKFVSELTTPFDDVKSLHMKFNNNYDSYTKGLNGDAAIDTSIAGFGTSKIVYSKSGDLSNLKVDGSFLRNGVEIAELTIKNGLQDKELHSSFEYKSTVTPHVKLTVDHTGDFTNLKSSARAEIGKKNILNGEATLSQRMNTVDAMGKVMYTIEDFGSDQASIDIHKDGELNNFNVELTGKHGAKTAKISGNFKNDDELTGDLTVNTPVKGYKNVGLSFKHSGNRDRFNCDGKVVFTDGEEYSGKVDFYRTDFKRIETVVELKTPIGGLEFTKYEYRHEGQSDSFTCSSTLQYGNSQRITYDLKAESSPKPSITITLKTPEEDFMASGSYEITWPVYAINGKLGVGSYKQFVLDGSLDASDAIVGALTLATPYDDFNDVGMSFRHTATDSGIDTEGRITYMDGKVISGKLDASMGKNVAKSSAELKTPFKGFEFTKYQTKHVFNRKMNKATTTIIYGDDQKIMVDAYYKVKPNPEASFTMTIPNMQEIQAFASIDNSWPKYELVCKLSPGTGEKYTLDGTFDAQKDVKGSLTIGTPFDNFNNVGVNFLHSGDSDKFGTEGTLTYMDGQEIFGKINFYNYNLRRIDASAELTTPFVGMETTKAEINYEDNSNSISTTAALEYNNGEKLNGNVKVTYTPNYEVLVTVNTPFEKFNVIRAQGALDITAPAYEVITSLNYGSNQVYSANGKFNLYSVEHMDGSLEVSTPLDTFEFTKAEYEHKKDSNGLDGSVSLTYNNGQKMSCEIKSTISPNFDGTVTVKTPFRGYEKMQGSATFESSYKKYETSSSLNLGQGVVYSMASELDYSIEPLKASTKINTPFRHFRNVEAVVTHEGGLTNFKTTGFLSSPITNHVNAQASLRYDAAMDMSAAASLQSSIEGFDDLKAEVKTSDLAGEMKTNAVVGWTSGQEIIYEGIFRQQDGWNEDKMHADVSLSTPFVAVRSLSLQMDHSAQTDIYVEKMNFELNGDSLLDFDAEYNFNDKKSAELVVRQPWPMQYTASQSSSEGTTDAELFVNWNRDEQDSNFRVQTTVTDKTDSYKTEKNLDVSVTYAARKVGVVHKLSMTEPQVQSNGYVYWDSDDESKVSYDMQINDNSRRRKHIVDGSFKLGLPTRTLGLTGSYSKNAATISTDAVFSWDADRDDDKQVGVKTTFTKGDSLKGDLSVSLPSMRKNIRIDGEVMMANGRVILDTKTDISYSRDSRKTLTLTSKIEDISTRNSHFNYSLALGVKHAYTNVDVQMSTKIGKSDEAMTLGMDTNYMTNDRQIKNLALLSEINMLKKQISVQFVNPMNKIEVVGDIVSEKPCKLRLLNKIDDEEIFRSDMTIDSDKKSFLINTYSDANILSFSAKYPNNTAFKVDFSRHTPEYDQEEALLAVRLNTSRLLHSRLSWRPEMFQEFKDFAYPRAMERAEWTVEELLSLNNAVAEELSFKYSAITDELSHELRPFITALNDEMALVADKMTEMSAELKEMYEHNQYYMQSMGEGVLKLQEKMQTLSQEYRTSYSEMIRSLKDNLRDIRRFPIGVRYNEYVTKGGQWLAQNAIKSVTMFEIYMTNVNEALNEYKTSVLAIKKQAMDTIQNATYVDYLADKISQVKNVDISPYISSFRLPEEYTNAIYNVPTQINMKLNDALDASEVKFVKEGINEVFQQSVWAYNYWELEENLEKQAMTMLNTLLEIVEDELKEYSEDLKIFVKNPITVWDPEHGEIQADIPLPIAVKRLDQLPNLKPLINKAEKFAASYMPNQGTWDSLVENVSDMWEEAENKTADDATAQLSKYRPSKKYRKKGGRKYKVKRARSQ